MSKIWFTSDTHFTHANIIKYCNRSFSNVDDMDKHLIYNINKYVAPGDTLYHLGDFAFNRRSLSVYKKIREQINCKVIHFIFGNHDDTLEDSRDKLHDIFWTFPEYMKHIEVSGQRITLCHYALAVWDKSHRGAWCLYGHSHSSAEKYLETAAPGRRSMDVGVDNIYSLFGEYRPISFDEVKKIMDAKRGFTFDHHVQKEEAV